MARIISALIKFALGSFLIIIGVKASMFFYRYDRIAHHEWYIAPCLIFILAGIMLLWRIVKPAPRSLHEIAQESTDTLRARGEKHTIDLTPCRIVATADEDGSRQNYSWNIISGEDKSVRSTGYVIVCDVEIGGRMRHIVSEPITDMEPFAIGFKMTNQKITYLYIDAADPERYYLDVRFLTQRVYH